LETSIIITRFLSSAIIIPSRLFSDGTFCLTVCPLFCHSPASKNSKGQTRKTFMREIDLRAEINKIKEFIRNYVHNSGFENAVIGLSGGIDSSLSAALAVLALGKEHVYGVMLPWKNSNPASYNDALELANLLGIHHEKTDITPMLEAYFNAYQPDADSLRMGNWMARTRMCVLYDLSAKYKGLVIGTSNRTELLVGYFTQHGDGACALEPIGHLYKTEVWKMAKILGIPELIINKVPTADLWTDQTDEGELGLLYPQLDEILFALTEQQLSQSDIVQKGYTSEQVTRVISLMKGSEFKRNLPPLIT
jgi:NAD+ synthase